MKTLLNRHDRFAAIAALAVAALSGMAIAADYGEIRTKVDKDVAARTNMPADSRDSSALKTTFDRDVAARTNMHRDPNDVGGVKSAPDTAVMERTNMGGMARKGTDPNTSTAGR